MPNPLVFIPVTITLICIVLLMIAVVIIRRQQRQLDDERWIRHKVLPLIAEVDHLDEDQREYLAPEVVSKLRAGRFNMDAALNTHDPTGISSKRR